MRLIRNASFVIFVLLAAALVSEDAAASSLSGCPSGCGCYWTREHTTLGRVEVDCYLVYDCEQTYPDFCDDPGGTLWEACNDLCGDVVEEGGYVNWYYLYMYTSCEMIEGCWGECACGHNLIGTD